MNRTRSSLKYIIRTFSDLWAHSGQKIRGLLSPIEAERKPADLNRAFKGEL
jgi:hypothetical protein